MSKAEVSGTMMKGQQPAAKRTLPVPTTAMEMPAALLLGLDVMGCRVTEPLRKMLPSDSTRVSVVEVSGPTHRLLGMLMAGLVEDRVAVPE